MPRIFAKSPAVPPREVPDTDLQDWIESGWSSEDPTEPPAPKAARKTTRKTN